MNTKFNSTFIFTLARTDRQRQNVSRCRWTARRWSPPGAGGAAAVLEMPSLLFRPPFSGVWQFEVNFSRRRAPWYWAAPPQLRLLNPPRRARFSNPPHGARSAWWDPAGSYSRRPITGGGGALLGFAYEVSLTAVHAAGLIAGSLYIIQSCFSHEERITSNNLSFSGATCRLL